MRDEFSQCHQATPFLTSGDGSTIVGLSLDVTTAEAFMHTEAEGMRGFGDRVLRRHLNQPRAVSFDGSVVVGNSAFDSNGNRKAWRWTEEGWNLFGPQDISANGQFLAGVGINPDGLSEAWLLRLDAPVPEPSSLALAALGLLSLLSCRYAGNGVTPVFSTHNERVLR